MEVYAQGNNGNASTQQYDDDEFEFEFEVELIYADDVAQEDDDDSDDGNDDDDSDDDNNWDYDDDDSDDDDDDDDDDNWDYNDDEDSDDEDDESNENEVVGVQIRVENSGTSDIDNDILFRAKITEEEPQTIPDTYDSQETLYLLDVPLESGSSREVSMDLSRSTTRGKIVIIWPLIESNKSGKTEDIPFVTLTISDENIERNIAISEFTQIRTYPNPTTGLLNVDIPNNTSIHQIVIYNETGQAVKTFEGHKNSGTVQLDLQGLPQGIYFAAMGNEQEQTIHYSKIFIRR